MGKPLRNLDIETPRWAVPLLEPARYKGAWGGRDGGKSHFFAEMMIEDCMKEPRDCVCIREYQSSLKYSAKKLIENKIDEMGLNGQFVKQNDRTITPHGKEIIYLGMQDHNAESIKSLEGFKRFWIEEARSLSQNSLDLLRPTARGDDVEMWYSWNPKNKTDPVDMLLRGDHPPPNSTVVSVNYLENPWCPKDQIEEAEFDKLRDLDKYKHVWLGGYQEYSDSLVFKNWRVEEFEAPLNAIHRQGSDFGFNSPTTLVRSHILGRTLFIDYEAYQLNCEINDIPDLYGQIDDSEKWPIIADSSRPETISYLKNHGYEKIFSSIKGKDSIKEGVEFLKSFDIVVHPRCVYTIDELGNYRWKVDQKIIDPVTNKAVVLPILVDDKNHIIDPLRYAHEGHRRAEKAKKKIQTFIPQPTRNPMARK